MNQKVLKASGTVQLSVHAVHMLFGLEQAPNLAVLALATELCPPDNNKFDIEKLQFCFDYISHNADRIGLQKENNDVPQKGLWRGNEPHVIAVITKEK